MVVLPQSSQVEEPLDLSSIILRLLYRLPKDPLATDDVDNNNVPQCPCMIR